MDALSDVLRAARLSGGVFLHADFGAPWCIASRIGPEDCGLLIGPVARLIPYHYVVAGEFEFQVVGEPRRRLRAGEMVLVPGNEVHIMASDTRLPPVDAGDLIQPGPQGGLARIDHGGGGPRTRIVCGYLACDGAEGQILLDGLPRVLVLDMAGSAGADWVRSSFQFAADEVAAGRPGSGTMLAKLSELLFVEAVRRHVETMPAEETGWLAGLRDPHVARALGLMHRDCARDWTVEDIGREVGLSRSALAERFGRLIGLAPMQYLARWRMQIAVRKLRETRDSLLQIALAVGYESEAAFSRAFKKAHGAAPAAWRRTQLGVG
ncbi:MAG: AraC family transcriptional regulator [Alphaproteobacteria bacterium]|nr:AraC family transcriptional regulator [Alphaproteobacteria bacterium]